MFQLILIGCTNGFVNQIDHAAAELEGADACSLTIINYLIECPAAFNTSYGNHFFLSHSNSLCPNPFSTISMAVAEKVSAIQIEMNNGTVDKVQGAHAIGTLKSRPRIHLTYYQLSCIM